MRTVDIEPNVEFIDKRITYRRDRVKFFFPEMPAERIDELASRPGDPYLLEQVERLAADGCPHELAYRILR
jgi:hypothetical protein